MAASRHRYRRFRPTRVVIEDTAVGSPLARRLERLFRNDPRVPVEYAERFLPPPFQASSGPRRAKSILVVRRQERIVLEHFGTDQDVSFDLAWGCPLNCSYCTLLHRLPRHPYIAVYCNVDEILAAADAFIAEARDPVLIVGDTTDSLAIEWLTGSLRRTIEHFGRHHAGRARLEFLTKSGEIDTILDADHRGATSVGYSLNTPRVIQAVEHGTAPLEERLECLRRALEAGYDLFIDIAPIFAYPGWKEEYTALFEAIHRALSPSAAYDPARLRFEGEAHWQKESELPLRDLLYPRSDRELVLLEKEEMNFPEGKLYRYPQHLHGEMERLFREQVAALFPGAARAHFCPPADTADRGTIQEV